MNNLIAVCLVIATVSAAVSAFYLIMTLIQMRRTAAEAEALLSYLNVEARKVGNIGDTIASAVSSVASSALFLKIPYVAKIAAGVFGAIAALLMRRKKNSASTCCAGEQSDSKK